MNWTSTAATCERSRHYGNRNGDTKYTAVSGKDPLKDAIVEKFHQENGLSLLWRRSSLAPALSKPSSMRFKLVSQDERSLSRPLTGCRIQKCFDLRTAHARIIS